MNFQVLFFFCFIGLVFPAAMRYRISHKYKAIGYNYRQMFLVMHYTVSDLESSLKILTGPRVSSHYVVPETPIQRVRKIYQLVPEENRAWTQGVSQWGSRSNLNDQGIGIEIINCGWKFKNYTRVFCPYPDFQIESVIQLSKDIIARYKIKPINVIGHSDVAPTRKQDPGPLFPWKKLYENGIGAWPDDCTVQRFMKSPECISVSQKEFLKDLSKYGYEATSYPLASIEAFQMHFRPSKYDGLVDTETCAILKALLEKYF